MPLLVESASDWSSSLTILIVAIIGAIGAIIASAFGGAFSSWFARHQERQAIAAAFAAEIQGFIDAINWREARKGIQQGEMISIGEGFFPVFDAHIAKIGLLPVDLAAKIVVFYTHAGGVVQDLRTLWAALVEKKINIQNTDEIKARLPKELDKLEGEAKALVPELQKEVARAWQDYLQPPQ